MRIEQIPCSQVQETNELGSKVGSGEEWGSHVQWQHI